jgi:hypothetical protein
MLLVYMNANSPSTKKEESKYISRIKDIYFMKTRLSNKIYTF